MPHKHYTQIDRHNINMKAKTKEKKKRKKKDKRMMHSVKASTCKV